MHKNIFVYIYIVQVTEGLRVEEKLKFTWEYSVFSSGFYIPVNPSKQQQAEQGCPGRGPGRRWSHMIFRALERQKEAAMSSRKGRERQTVFKVDIITPSSFSLSIAGQPTYHTVMQ